MILKDWTLATIASASKPLQPVQLQKALFLLSQNLPLSVVQEADFYAFEPHDYGPFCRTVYEDAEALEAEGLVEIRRPPASRFNLYSSTEAGDEKAAEFRTTIPRRAASYVDRVVTWTQSLSFNQLVSSIYQTYPSMKVNSVFQADR